VWLQIQERHGLLSAAMVPVAERRIFERRAGDGRNFDRRMPEACHSCVHDMTTPQIATALALAVAEVIR
jgi:hypothetical protein